MNRIAHLSNLREHHRGSGTHQEIGRIANCWIGSNSGKCIAPSTLQADYKIRGGTNLASPGVELHQTFFGHPHNRMDHIAKTPMLVVLQPDDIWSRREDWQRIAGKHFCRLQLLTTEADDQRRSPKIWV